MFDTLFTLDSETESAEKIKNYIQENAVKEISRLSVFQCVEDPIQYIIVFFHCYCKETL